MIKKVAMPADCDLSLIMPIDSQPIRFAYSRSSARQHFHNENETCWRAFDLKRLTCLPLPDPAVKASVTTTQPTRTPPPPATMAWHSVVMSVSTTRSIPYPRKVFVCHSTRVRYGYWYKLTQLSETVSGID